MSIYDLTAPQRAAKSYSEFESTLSTDGLNMHFQFYAVALRYVRRCWYKLKRKRYKLMNFWNRFKWCLVGGFAYAAGRALFYFIQHSF